MLRSLAATRYVAPLREGGSLPALVEADDEGMYVVKLRGAGQGPLALVAEVIVGELARACGLPVPELAIVEIPAELSRAEPDPEIQELLEASAGTNVGLDFLPGSLPYQPGGGFEVSPELAAAIVWLDALTENIDRTPRNPNLLVWHGRLWLIDHGAALYRQHAGLDVAASNGSFPSVADHILLPHAGSVLEADSKLAGRVDGALLERVVAAVPEDWFTGPRPKEYVAYLTERVASPRTWVEQAEVARDRL